MRYPGPVGNDMLAELQRLQQVLEQPSFPHLQLENWQAAPSRPFDGMMVFTDATAWNPGAGAGFYGYHSGAWNLLG